MAEYFMTSEPGVPLDQAGGVPGTPIPTDGKVVPSDAPGFGWELGDSDLEPWTGQQA